MIIYIKTVDKTVFEVETDYYETMAMVKEKIKESKGFPVEDQVLIWAGRILKDDSNFIDNDIMKESTFHLVIKTRGG